MKSGGVKVKRTERGSEVEAVPFRFGWSPDRGGKWHWYIQALCAITNEFEVVAYGVSLTEKHSRQDVLAAAVALRDALTSAIVVERLDRQMRRRKPRVKKTHVAGTNEMALCSTTGATAFVASRPTCKKCLFEQAVAVESAKLDLDGARADAAAKAFFDSCGIKDETGDKNT